VQGAWEWLRGGADGILDALAAGARGWLVLAVALHLCAQATRGLAWHGVLTTTWPEVRVGRCPVVAAHVAGAGLSGVLSPRGADLLRLGLLRRRLPGLALSALAGTLVVEGAVETLFGLGVGAWVLGRGMQHAGAAGPAVAGVVLAVALAILGGCAACPRLRARTAVAARDFAAGLGALRRPARFARRALSWQLASRAVRLAAVACFLRAFGLPVTAATLGCLAAAQGGARALPLPGVGPTAGAVLLVATFASLTGSSGQEAAIAALAIAMPAVLTSLGVVLSLLLLCALLRVRSPLAALAHLRALRASAAVARA
jgi:hypothetical protein